MPSAAWSAIAGYLLGSLTPALWVSRAVAAVDIRQIGSGNAGATNVARMLGWRPGLLVLVLDAGKGWAAAGPVAAWLATSGDALAPWAALSAGIAAVCGHVWPLFARLRGGKGVATGAGVLLALDPGSVVWALIAFLAVAVSTRFIALASIAGAAAAAAALLLRYALADDPALRPSLIFAVAMTLLVVWTHRTNLVRLRRGTEARFERTGPKDE